MAWQPYRNLGLKLIALVLGALLWLTVAGHQIERRVTVPLSFSNVPTPLELTGERLDSIGVYVRGDDTIVSGLSGDNVRVVVSLADAQPGENLIPLRIEYVTVPIGVEVMKVDPAVATVTLERSVRTSVVVRPTVDGTPAPGFGVSAISVQPATVTVEGPESRVLDAIAVMTDRINVAGRSATFSADVTVGVADAQLRVVQPRTVRVTVQIDPHPAPVDEEVP
jgi:YbbR domain-containing protein